MKHLVTIISLYITLLQAENFLITLPNSYFDMQKYLNTHIQLALHVTIISNNFSNYSLKQSLLTSLKNGTKITLFSYEISHDLSQLIQYQGVSYSLLVEPIHNNKSYIIFDNNLSCTLSGNLDESTLKRIKSRLTCKENLSPLQQLNLWIKQSSPYLKE